MGSPLANNQTGLTASSEVISRHQQQQIDLSPSGSTTPFQCEWTYPTKATAADIIH
jgi:hypothetical protein